MCRMISLGMLTIVRFNQAAPGASQRRSDGPESQASLGGNLRIAQPSVPQQENFTVSRRQCAERILHRRNPFVVLDQSVRRGLDRGLRHGITLEQREVALAPYCGTGL